jgi:hypothetical protein
MAHPAAQFIGVPTGVETMIVAIAVEAAGLRWFRHNFARFPATRVHRTPGGGYNLLYKMPLPPVPILQTSLGKLARSVDVLGEGGSIIWPAPPPYHDVTAGCVVALDAPIAPLPKWIVDRVTAKPKVKETPVRRFPLRGIDVQRARITAFVRHSAQGTRADVAFVGGHAAGQLVAQGALGEKEAVELITKAAIEAGLEPFEARNAALRGVKAALGETSAPTRCAASIRSSLYGRRRRRTPGPPVGVEYLASGQHGAHLGCPLGTRRTSAPNMISIIWTANKCPYDIAVEGRLWGMKSGSRDQGRTAVVGFESGPLLLMIRGT